MRLVVLVLATPFARQAFAGGGPAAKATDLGGGVGDRYALSAVCDPSRGDVYLLGGVVGGFRGRHAPDRLIRVTFPGRAAPRRPDGE